MDSSNKGEKGQARVWQLKRTHSCSLRAEFPMYLGHRWVGNEWNQQRRLLSFFITVQCLISAVALADDNRLLGMNKRRLFSIWSFFVCIWGDRRFLILKSQTAWTISPTISLAYYLQSHSFNFPVLGKKNQLSTVWTDNVGRWKWEINTHLPLLLDLFWSLRLTHSLLFVPYVGESHEKGPWIWQVFFNHVMPRIWA